MASAWRKQRPSAWRIGWQQRERSAASKETETGGGAGLENRLLKKYEEKNIVAESGGWRESVAWRPA
jgi:hypothetical protein